MFNGVTINELTIKGEGLRGFRFQFSPFTFHFSVCIALIKDPKLLSPCFRETSNEVAERVTLHANRYTLIVTRYSLHATR